jgi:hypothetical protein
VALPEQESDHDSEQVQDDLLGTTATCGAHVLALPEGWTSTGLPSR